MNRYHTGAAQESHIFSFLAKARLEGAGKNYPQKYTTPFINIRISFKELLSIYLLISVWLPELVIFCPRAFFQVPATPILARFPKLI